MEIDVNLRKPTTANGLELKTISAGSYSNNNGHSNLHSHLHNNNNRINNHHQHERSNNNSATTSESSCTQPASSPPFSCCGILSRLLCSSHTRGKTATSSGDYNTYNNCGNMSVATQANVTNGHTMAAAATAALTTTTAPHHNSSYMNLLKKNHTHRRTPQEIYFESRGKSCKKLLKFNGNSNKK